MILIPISLICLFGLFFETRGLPGINDVGGTNCPTTNCIQSYACDPRCAPVTFGASGSVLRYCTSDTFNTNGDCCCGCATVQVASTNSYFWLGYDDKTCTSVCPPRFYPPPSGSGYSCRPCHAYCLTCTSSTYNDCSTCETTSYQVNSTTCFADSSLHSYGRYNPCPDNYYGIQINRQCIACPTGCSSCAIQLIREMPNGATFGTSYANYNMNSMNCTGNGNDALCKYTLQCYGCYTGYTLISGHCVSNSQCQLYSKYNSSAGGSFSSANCYCFSGFNQIFPGYCQKCASNCKTCSSTTSSSCTSCPDGALGASCVYGFSYMELLTAAPPTLGGDWTTNVGTPDGNVPQGSCTGYVFGYYGYYNQGVYSFSTVSYNTYLNGASVTSGTTLTYGQSMFPQGATLTFSNPASFSGTAHYSVHVRMTLLFIDDWTNGMSILFFQGGQSRYQFNYQMEGVVGQYLCGYASYDHHDIADFTFPHTSDALTLKIYSSAQGMHWGVKDVVIHALMCDSSCNSCSGPSSSECVAQCTDPTRVVVDGVCVCDSANGYYLNVGSCATTCGGLIRNDLTHTCVATCSFPNYFIQTSSDGTYRSCVVNCDPAQYKKVSLSDPSIMTCVADCFDVGETDITANQFNFQGFEKVCYNHCPSGSFGDPVSHNCVNSCPTYNSSTVHGFFSSGYFCYENCPSGWAYQPRRACLSSCPSGYYKNYLFKNSTNSSICQQQCSVTLDGLFHYGDNSTGYCTDLCSTGTYGDIASFLCLKVCNSTAYAQSLTLSGGNIQRLCVVNCSLADGLYGNPQSGFCVLPANCPSNYYGDPLTYVCTRMCSGTDYYGDNTTRVCTTSTCAGRAYRQNDTKICVATCLNNNSLLAVEWGDNTTGFCVGACPSNYFGDPQFNSECVRTCSSSPSSTFGLNGLCVVNCSNETWADPFHTNRVCTDSCTPNRYGYNNTRTCVVNCPDGQFAHNVTYGATTRPLCVPGCTQDSSYFGNIVNNRCEAQCPTPYYGDVTGNRLCRLKCPWPYYASNCTTDTGGNTVISQDRVCRLDCTSCGYADNSSQLCAWTSNGCMNLTFANNGTSSCVIPMQCTGFADPVSRYCISVCQNIADANIYFGDPSTKNCVLICPQNPDTYGELHGNITTNQTCVSSCSSTYVRDPQHSNRWCVDPTLCSRSPLVLFGDTVKDLCVIALNCTDGYYGDNNTKKCVLICGGPTLLYADNSTKQCVSQCGLGWFALNITTGQGVCSQYCPSGQWADNFTVRCTTRCSNLTYGTNYTMNWASSSYSFTVYGVCQTQCRNGEFARDQDNLCVSNCGNNNASDLWGDPLSKTCKTSPFSCPSGYYADNQTHMCVKPLGCSIVGGIQYVADNLTRTCVPKCPASEHNFADMAKQLCVARCPDGFYGYNSTLKCVQECLDPTNGSYDGSYADPQLNQCVQVCTAYPSQLFGENVTYKCVEARYCPNLTWAQVTVYSRQCRPYCPAPNTYSKGNLQMYADNLTKTCVEECPTYSYADLSQGYGMCVYVCPKLTNNTLQFADNSTKQCVMVCPVSQSTFGDNATVSCVVTCPLGSYAQVTPFRYCVQKCAVDTWGQDIKRTCVTSPLLCPTVNGSIYYAQNISTMCVKKCPGPTNSTAGSWGQNTTRVCLSSCLLPNGTQSGFMWNLTRVCIDICPQEVGVEGSYSDQGMCYYVCMTANYYRDPQNKRSCQSGCTFSPVKQYAEDTTWRCLTKCPSYPMQYYADDNLKKCVSTCTLSYRKLEATRVCVQTCPNGTFFNSDTYQCLSSCPTQTSLGYRLYGDTSSSEGKCVNSTDCPNNTYADDKLGLCVSACTQNQWIYGKNCVSQCPDGYYGNPNTLKCVVPSDCPSNYFADNETVACVSVCLGSFGDELAHTCVLTCPNITGQLYYADPVTRKCSTSCTNNTSIQLIKNDINQTCVSECSPGLFFDPFTLNCTPICSNNYYSDNSSRTCVQACPASPPLFGQSYTHTCVEECLNVTEFRYVPSRVCIYPCPTNYYMQNVSRICVTVCPNMTYSDITSGYCVSNCSTNYSDDDTNTCVSTCPEPYFNDPTTYKCVYDCPYSPQAYFQVVNGTSRYCDTSCPTGQFRDFTSFICTEHCQLSPVTFADTTSGSCLAVCSTGYYGYLNDRTCRGTCPGGMYADPNTRMCVDQCDPNLGYYGDAYVSPAACVAICSSGYYGSPFTQSCVDVCPSFPKMYGFDNQNSSSLVRECVYSCPYPWVEDNYTGKCHLKCQNTAYPYLDKASKSCVSSCSSPVYQYAYMPSGQTVEGECVQFCPTVGIVHFFALLTNNTCVTKCPDGLYGSTTNNTCMPTCILADNFYADPAVNLCVAECTHNTSYFSYADEFSRTCVTECPADEGQVGDRLIWKCVSRCSSLSEYADLVNGYCVPGCPPNYFADNTTQTCVSNCSLYTLMYGDTTNRVCVEQCPLSTLYADNTQRLCVISTHCSTGLFGYNATRQCIAVCPIVPDLYGDPLTKTCEYRCPNSTDFYYADPDSRLCLLQCPSVPAYYGQNITQRCVIFCPNNSYTDNYTRLCIKICSIAEFQTFADNTTNQCVRECPTEPNYYASNYTWECVYNCPSTPSMFADNSTRSCVYYCPGGIWDTYADPSTRRCVHKCPNLTYNENSTRQCLDKCISGYADPSSKYCIARCPPYSYGENTTQTCLSDCPIVNLIQLYAEDGNSLCMKVCLAVFNTYADPYSKRCVRICPISQDYYAEPTSRTCMHQCPESPIMFADFSTRFCVYKCPAVPSLFAIISSRVCTNICPNNSWADNNSRICLQLCVTSPETFGDNSTWTCVTTCPTAPDYYADNSTHLCVPLCPSVPDFYADNITRKCVYNCSNNTYADSTTRRCVSTCPEGYFGVNSTWRCELKCPWRQFADELLNLCVKKCSIDPIYYGNPDNLICVPQCPQVNNSFGNPLTQQCVNYQIDGTSGCQVAYFSDNSSRLCVQVCPMAEDTYGDNSTWKCVAICPAGTENTFADNSTMRCVKICPSYPNYYAEQYSRRCVHHCLEPNSTYPGSFSDNSTRKCVETCPSNPDYYSDNSTARCVFYCPREPLTFADNQTRRCVDVCPSSPDIYGDPSTLRCVPKCPELQQTFADNNTRLCVKVCPNDTLPPLYAQNISQRCLPGCPSGSYADNQTQRCVAVCPRSPQTYGDPSSFKCVSRCPATPDIYADPISQKCLPLCQLGYYAENNTRKCLQECLWNVTNYADNLTRRCVTKCPMSELTWGDNETKRCVSQCSDTPTTYADNITQTCVLICSNISTGGYADNRTRICVTKCPDNSYGDITTRYCVRYCPAFWYGYTVDNLCVSQCPTPWFADNSTWMCVIQCPRGQNLYGQTINNTCVGFCPEGTYANDENQQCVTRCPNSSQTALGQDTFGENTTNSCVEECPYPLFGYPVAQVCVDICPDPYYYNFTNHRCYKCPDPCANCVNPFNCISCNLGYYLHSGACVESCPTFPVILYANPNRICGTAFNCTQGFYALNETKSCVSSCPAGYYVNVQAQACDACMKGCVNCTTVSSCLACNINTAIWSNYVCYTFCSPLKRFYTLKGCVSSCPTGTYLKLTTCQNCSVVCKTCVITAQNCLICANGYYRSNGICVSQCPTGTIAQLVGGSQTCVSCSVVSCKEQPLTFTTTQFVDNFNYNVQIQFSQPVNITAEIDKVIQIKQVNNARLLAVTSFSYLNYTIYDYGNGLYSFVLNNYNPSSGSQVQVQIIDPSAIQTASGQMPQTTRSEFTVDTDNLYSADSYNQGISGYLSIVAIAAFILLLFSFGTHHSVWMPMYDFMQFIIVCIFINVTYPPNLLYAIRSSFASAFTFLPNFFQSTFQTPAYDKNYNNNNIYSLMKDAAFLRVMGSIYFILLMLIVVLIVIGILSKKAPTKQVKKWAKSFLKEIFWKKHLHGLVYILFLPVFMLGVYNMTIYGYLASSALQIFSILSTYLFMVTFLIVVIYFTYKMRKIAKDFPVAYLMMQKAYNFIVYQKTVLVQNKNHYFTYEKNEFDLTDAREPKVNELMVFPYPIETKAGPWEIAFPLVSYLHKLLTAVFLTFSFNNPVIQLILLILINLAYLIYIIVKKPFFGVKTKQYNNQIYIHNILVISVIYIALLIFVFLYSGLSIDKRVLIGDAICGIIIEGFTVNIIYFYFRTYNYYHHHIWKTFVRSDFFRINYIIEHLQWTKSYDEEQNKLMKEVKPRSQFLQAIAVQTGQALANMVMKQPSISTSTKQKMKALQLRPNKAQVVSKEYAQIFSSIINEKEKSNKSAVSSERMSKQDRKKVRDTIFGEKAVDEKHLEEAYSKLELIDEKNQEEMSSNKMSADQDNLETEFEYEYIEEEYPDGTPMDEIMEGCKKGNVILH